MWISEISMGLRWTGVLGLSLVVAVLAYNAFVPPPLEPVKLGEKGRQRERWRRRSSSSSLVDGLVRRIGRWVQDAADEAWLSRLERALVLAGHPNGFRASEWIAVGLMWLALSALAPVLVPREWRVHAWYWLPLAYAAAAPWLGIRTARQRRVLMLERSLPVAMDLVSLCVRAGGDFPGALRFVVAELSEAHSVCRHELAQVLESLALGQTREQALRGLSARVDSPAVRELVAALVQSETRGIPLGESLTTQAQSLRRVRSVRAEELAAKAGVRMVVPLMIMLCSILLLLLGPMLIEGAEL